MVPSPWVNIQHVSFVQGFGQNVATFSLLQAFDDEDEEDEGEGPERNAPQERQSKGTQPVLDAGAVMSCLKRALKIAHAAQQQLSISRRTQDTTPVLLFLEILNKYLYYFDQKLPPITPDVLKASTPSVSKSCAMCQLS